MDLREKGKPSKPINTMQEFQIEVFNSSGQKLNIPVSDNAPDFSDLPQGVYTILFHQGNDTYTDDFEK
jgi:hypothetical protein